MSTKDIQFTRSGNWKVRVDGEIYSSHNEEKEGYESLLRARREYPDAVIKLIPEFEITEHITSYTYTEAEIEAFINQILTIDPDKRYEYILFEVDEAGIKLIGEPKEL